MAPGRGRGQNHGDHDERDRADRQGDGKHPPPGQVVHEEPADQRADDARHPEDGAERALVLASLARRDDVADDGLGQHEQAAAADALHGAERDQLGHVAGQPGQRGADQEDDDRGHEQVLAAVLVAELAPDLSGRRGGEEDDGGQRGGDDRLVQRGQQHGQHQRDVNNQQPARLRGLLSLTCLAGHPGRLRSAEPDYERVIPGCRSCHPCHRCYPA